MANQSPSDLLIEFSNSYLDQSKIKWEEGSSITLSDFVKVVPIAHQSYQKEKSQL